jgi:hypothetical protein
MVANPYPSGWFVDPDDPDFFHYVQDRATVALCGLELASFRPRIGMMMTYRQCVACYEASSPTTRTPRGVASPSTPEGMMADIAAVMLIEEVTGQRAYLQFAPLVVPVVGDRLECGATIYLNENVAKAISPSEQIAVRGTVIERTFIHRGNGAWVCHLKLNHHAFRSYEGREEA